MGMTESDWLELFKELSSEELQTARRAFNKVAETNRSKRQGQIMRNVCTGDTVSFNHRGFKVTGKVKKVNIKTVDVEMPDSERFWRVTASLLTIEDTAD